MQPVGRVVIGMFLLVLTLGLLSGPNGPLRKSPAGRTPAGHYIQRGPTPARGEPPAEAATASPDPAPAATQAPATSPSAVAAAVAGNTPAKLLIPVINVSTRVEHVGIGPDGAMETPYNINNVAWFSPGVRPGETGDAVIDGHVGLPGQPLVFAHLNRLRLGDAITIIRGDGHSAHFIVSGSHVVPAGSRPTRLFATDGAPTLSLITCTGPYDGGNYSYAERLIVDARYAGLD